MYKKILFSIFLMMISSNIFSEIYHHDCKKKIISNCYKWKKQVNNFFDELLITWNIDNFHKGHYAVYASVKIDNKWSDYLLYAIWGNNEKKSFCSKGEKRDVRVCQDAVAVLNSKKGEAFKIKIIAKDGAAIKNLKKIHVCASYLPLIGYKAFDEKAQDISLEVKGLSQMALKDERNHRLCSPTSTTAVIKYLNNESNLHPIEFAEKIWDSGFDIFGNWVFNAAQAYSELKNEDYSCWAERLKDFSDVLFLLHKGLPVVISIRGPLPKSAKPYASGHLLVIKGYDSKTKEVICMDPAFDKDEDTSVKYNLNDLLIAWERRKNIAYIFYKK